MKKTVGIVIGAILVACGVIYGLEAFGLFHIAFSLDGWWTLFIIVPCLSGMLSGQDLPGNLLGICVGVLLLLAARGVFAYSVVWKLLVPLVIVVLGIRIILRTLGLQGGERAPALEDGEVKVSGVFHEENVDFSDETLRLARVGAFFGGSGVNLRNADIVEGCCIDLACAFGGVDFFLPDNVIVKNNTFCLFGGVGDSRTPEKGEGKQVTLYLNGFCIFGGAQIK